MSLLAADLFSVKGWTCVVTGGGTGIGLMAARTLAANGARVWITGRRKEVLETTVKEHSIGGGELIPLQMDQTDKKSIESAVAEISKKEKCVHLLFNNAGIAKGKIDLPSSIGSAEALSKAMFDVDMAAWEDMHRTNVTAYYYTTAAFLPLLHKASELHKGFSACVLTNSSMSGITKESQNGQFGYNTSKAGTIQLTELMATEFARANMKVRVNSIAPGYFPSEMTTSESDEKNTSSMSADGFREERGVPAGRPGREEDMGALVLALATNQYINGLTAQIDGAWLLEHS